MEFENAIKNSYVANYNSSLQNEMNQIDNLIENISFQSRNDNSQKRDDKILNSIKLYLYNNDFEKKEDIEQKKIKKLLSIIGNNYKKRIKSQFKPLSKPKKVSLIGKIIINNSNNNSDNFNNINEFNSSNAKFNE